MKSKMLVLAAGLSLTTGCAGVAAPLSGILYAEMQYPSYYQGVDNAGPGGKTGKAEASSILGLIATGDASIAAAARNGGIRTIHTADTHVTNILGLYATYTTVVTGD